MLVVWLALGPPHHHLHQLMWGSAISQRRRVEGDPFEALPEPLVARVASYVHYDRALSGTRYNGVHLACLNKRFRAACEAHAAEFRSAEASHALEGVPLERHCFQLIL